MSKRTSAIGGSSASSTGSTGSSAGSGTGLLSKLFRRHDSKQHSQSYGGGNSIATAAAAAALHNNEVDHAVLAASAPNSAASFRDDETDPEIDSSHHHAPEDLHYTSISPRPSSALNTSTLPAMQPMHLLSMSAVAYQQQQSSPSHESHPMNDDASLLSSSSHFNGQMPNANATQQQQQQQQRRSTPPIAVPLLASATTSRRQTYNPANATAAAALPSAVNTIAQDALSVSPQQQSSQQQQQQQPTVAHNDMDERMDAILTPQLTMTQIQAHQLANHAARQQQQMQQQNNSSKLNSSNASAPSPAAAATLHSPASANNRNNNKHKNNQQFSVAATAAAHHASSELDSKLHNAHLSQHRIIRLLLLGTNESGKSTLLKQIKLMHCADYTKEERLAMRRVVFSNTLQSIQQLLRATLHQYKTNLSSLELQQTAQRVLAMESLDSISMEFARDVQSLYTDPSVKLALSRASEYNLLDSASYFLCNVHRFVDQSSSTQLYLPTNADILRTRQVTRGIAELEFELQRTGTKNNNNNNSATTTSPLLQQQQTPLRFRLMDVGASQRGRSKKWLHCFDDVRAVLFIASLSEYDQFLSEDEAALAVSNSPHRDANKNDLSTSTATTINSIDKRRNRLQESLLLFEHILALPWFRQTSIILFLNKNDLFAEKIKTVDLGLYFPQYNAGCRYESALEFIRQLFLSQNKDEATKHIYCHVTEAIDTQQMTFVWQATQHIVMESNLVRAKIG